MKPFRFSLQALHTLRRRQEHEAMEKYAQALLARQRAIEELENADRELAALWFQCSNELKDGCSAGEMVQLRNLCHRAEEKRQPREVAVGVAQRAVNQRLQSMLLARQQREAVDKHLEHERASYDRALAREDQKTLDDLAHRHVAPALTWKSMYAV